MADNSIQFCQRCGTPLITKHHSGKLRPICPACGWVYFPDPKVAVVVLIKENDQVLLVQRRYDPQKGHWTLPSGFVDAGEDPMEAVVRECLEETGLTVGDVRLLDVIYSSEYPRGASILILYQAQRIEGELRPGDDARQVRFYNRDNLPPLAFLSTRHIMDTYF
ncbi:MAG: DNA mismatch repair protein MutT [Anaerolineales bacterium]|nr:MAG: DNA mismatch repair protein MutT [Anaerolineales bacterium]